MKHFVLILILLVALSFIEPANASLSTPFAIPPDCSMSDPNNSATPIILNCTIVPSDTAYVDNLLPTKSFGDSAVLVVENVPSVPVAMDYAFLKFDLARNVPADLVQSGATPENASLQMYVRLTNFFYNATVAIHMASPANWSEKNLTWNTMPQFDPPNESINIIRNGTWARWSIAQLIPPLSSSSEQLAFAAISSETNWRNLVWFDSDQYPFANGTTSPALNMTFVEPYLTIRTPFSSIPITIGARTIITDSTGAVRVLIPWGDYPVTMPDAIPLTNGTRAQFTNWSDGLNSSSRMLPVGNNITLDAHYGIQHELTATSTYGFVSGTGWYFENTQATLTLSSSAVPVQGLEGLLGARDVFDHWTGACTGNRPQCTIVMNAPEYAAAVWRVDWSQTVIGGSVLAVMGGLFVLFEMNWSKRRSHRSDKRRRSSTNLSSRDRRRKWHRARMVRRNS